MQKAHITYEEFLSYLKIKPGVVHIKDSIVYKHSPNSEEIIKAIEESKTNPVFKHISIPLSYLYVKDLYFGFTYEFNTKLHLVDDAVSLGIITDKTLFIQQLFSIIEQLNEIDMCYWDFHKNNIFTDETGSPFLLDYDDMVLNPSPVNKYHQVKYLTEYILNLLLNQDKDIGKYIREPAIKQYLSSESTEYLEKLNKRTGEVCEFPYRILEELSCEAKKELIKSKIK